MQQDYTQKVKEIDLSNLKVKDTYSSHQEYILGKLLDPMFWMELLIWFLSKHSILISKSPKNEQAKVLRKNFVFKVIPILNPDGVARGYYRLDTMAYNLNRYYLNPSKVRLFQK